MMVAGEPRYIDPSTKDIIMKGMYYQGVHSVWVMKLGMNILEEINNEKNRNKKGCL
jgi:hypothetical protein